MAGGWLDGERAALVERAQKVAETSDVPPSVAELIRELCQSLEDMAMSAWENEMGEDL